jgi:hypothetical protein
MKFISIKVPKNNEYTHEQGLALFSSLLGKESGGFFANLFGTNTKNDAVSFNILSAKQRITFIIVMPDEDVPHITNQILAQYNNAEVSELPGFKFKTKYVSQLYLNKNKYLPINTIDHFAGTDPMASILSTISRSSDPNAVFWFQMVLKPIGGSWQQSALSYIDSLGKVGENETQTQHKRTQITLVQEKIRFLGFKTYLRIAANSQENLNLFYSSFNIYAQPSGNHFSMKKPGLLSKDNLIDSMNHHKAYGESNLLNLMELTSLWHMPAGTVNIPNIAWGKKLTLEAPENLPISELISTEEEKKDITFLAKTSHKNQEQIFGVKSNDRMKHMYIIGKTGTGKSTFIENMAIDDIRKGRGVAVLDPHGDAIKIIMDYIPKKRINDVVYFNPADREYAYPLNILDIPNQEQKELMVSGIVAIFYKLYANSWGPRLEYILRNTLFTLANTPNTNLGDVVKILVDKNFRMQVVGNLQDPFLKQFWEKEFEKFTPQQMQEAISPIVNKVGQFVTSPIMRRIIAQNRSKVKIEEIMNSGKIFLCDLSQGKIGEDNATLLGSMIITQMQIAAMNRAYIPEQDRVPFYLYVDEFQNFATSSFIKILSEARKYKLALTLANQYINQIDPTIINAILGNAGTLMCFTLGAQDSVILGNEFGKELTPEDLSSLEKFQMVMRLSIDNMTSNPFHAQSLPLPKNISGQADKIIEASRKRYGVKL